MADRDGRTIPGVNIPPIKFGVFVPMLGHVGHSILELEPVDGVSSPDIVLSSDFSTLRSQVIYEPSTVDTDSSRLPFYRETTLVSFGWYYFVWPTSTPCFVVVPPTISSVAAFF